MTAARRIEVPGGPLGLDVAAGRARVVAADAGQLVDVDLATGATVPMDIGSPRRTAPLSDACGAIR